MKKKFKSKIKLPKFGKKKHKKFAYYGIGSVIVIGCLILAFNSINITYLSSSASANPKELTDVFLSREGGGIKPLPLAASWSAGRVGKGITLEKQKEFVQSGRYFLPALEMPDFNMTQKDNLSDGTVKYYVEGIKFMKDNNLPIVFVGQQPESILTDKNKSYINAPANEATSVMVNGVRKLTPYAEGNTTKYWYQAGNEWTTSPLFKLLQSIYPSPPRVVFNLNNEAQKLTYEERNLDPKLASIKKYNPFVDTREGFNFEFGDRYKNFFEGFKNGFTQYRWKDNFETVAYGATGPGIYGRWAAWQNYTYYSQKFPHYGARVFSGGSYPYYDDALANNINDFQIWSPQIELNNVVSFQKAMQKDKSYWEELSVWDGFKPGKGCTAAYDCDKRTYYDILGEPYTPDRYQGYVQYGMWLARPKVVREFRGYNQEYSGYEAYFAKILDSVDLVHNNKILKDFWQRGVLLENKKNVHPYQANVDIREGRLFDLSAFDNPNPPLPQRVDVFSIGLADPSTGDILLYFYAPLARNSTKAKAIDVPGFGNVDVTATQKGSFYILKKQSKDILEVTSDGTRLVKSGGVIVDKPPIVTPPTPSVKPTVTLDVVNRSPRRIVDADQTNEAVRYYNNFNQVIEFVWDSKNADSCRLMDATPDDAVAISEGREEGGSSLVREMIRRFNWLQDKVAGKASVVVGPDMSGTYYGNGAKKYTITPTLSNGRLHAVSVQCTKGSEKTTVTGYLSIFQ